MLHGFTEEVSKRGRLEGEWLGGGGRPPDAAVPARSRFGDGYMITVRTKSSLNVKEVVRFFNRNFPEAVLKVRLALAGKGPPNPLPEHSSEGGSPEPLPIPRSGCSQGAPPPSLPPSFPGGL